MDLKTTEKKRLFIDMDGTLAEFKNVTVEIENFEDAKEATKKVYDILKQDGYYRRLHPQNNVLNAVRKLMREDDIEIFILSAVIPDCPALKDKNAWLDEYLPEIPTEKRIFVPDGSDKKEYIPNGIRPDDFLLDDYTHNLNLWQPPAKGIKLLNGINHTNGTWEHDRLSYEKNGAELARNIKEIMDGREVIMDEPPQKRKEEKKKDYNKILLDNYLH